ncbi:MAG: class I SAM-dependent methyltransferase [Deltaproteobacteria bacterium]|nr:class I SAM-dependent methyltransferase [Deltaproteobacteria bacterium]
MIKRFRCEKLLEIRDGLSEQLAVKPEETLCFEVPDPDLGGDLYSGEVFSLGGDRVRHRGYKSWVDLAELLGCRMLTPRKPSDEHGAGQGFVELRFAPLNLAGSFHDSSSEDPTEKYGRASAFAHIDKSEEPTFAMALEASLRAVDLEAGARVLDLGINSGEEFELLRWVYGSQRFTQLQLVGIDHCESAISHAQQRFSAAHCRLLQHDINQLSELALGRFDLLLSIGTLHSPGIRDSKKLFMTLVQEHLSAAGAVILGFPNCRWMGGEVLHGARPRNYNYPEQSLLFKDVDFCKRYLQQHRFRVTLTGKYYVVLTATRTGLSRAPRID